MSRWLRIARAEAARDFSTALRYPLELLSGVVIMYVFFIGLFGQTLGMWVAGIRCVSVVDQRPVGIPRALLRGVMLALVVPALIMDEDKRGVHDRYATTVVIAGRR